jgi:hypothetical protein
MITTPTKTTVRAAALALSATVHVGCVVQAPLPSELQPGVRRDNLGLIAKVVIDDGGTTFGLTTDIRCGDFDENPGKEIVVAGSSAMAVYDASFQPLPSAAIRSPDGTPADEFAQFWATPYAIVVVDGGRTIEFLGSDFDAHVLRHANGTVRWTIPHRYEGSDHRQDFGDLDGDGKMEFVLEATGDADYVVVDHEAQPLWSIPGHVWSAFMADVAGDENDEVVAVDSNGSRVAYNDRGTVAGVAESKRSIQRVTYPAGATKDHFLAVEYRLADSQTLEVVRTTIEDFAGNTVIELTPPVTQPDTTCSVKLKAQSPPYLALCWWSPFQGSALFGFQSTTAFLRIYAAQGTLAYEEAMFGRECALAAIPSSEEGVEDLLFGTSGKVWRYAIETTSVAK